VLCRTAVQCSEACKATTAACMRSTAMQHTSHPLKLRQACCSKIKEPGTVSAHHARQPSSALVSVGPNVHHSLSTASHTSS
jgi:hypothetical protein